MIKNNIDTTSIEPDSTISRAVWEGAIDVVHELLDAGENVDFPTHVEWTYEGRTGRTPLMYAILRNDVSMICLLLSYRADVNLRTVSGRTPVMYAGMNILPLLLEKGADLNAGDNEGYTALTLAVWNSDIVKATWLLNNGAEVDLRPTRDVKTPLMYALIKDNVPMIELLVSRGANVNAVTHDGRTPIMFASVNALPILYTHGADLSAVDRGWRVGLSVLMSAIEDGEVSKAEWLIQHGADREFMNDFGETAVTCAITNEMSDILPLLYSRGVTQSLP